MIIYIFYYLIDINILQMQGKNRKIQKKNESTDYYRLQLSNQSNTVRRIMKDIKEIETNPIPTYGVSAKFMEDDIYTWHGNIVPHKDCKTFFRNTVFHFVMTIPHDYPMKAPTVQFAGRTITQHPCIQYNNTLNSDFFNKWKPIYTIQSVLQQISIIFDEEVYHNRETEKEKAELKKLEKQHLKENEEINEYICARSGHKGAKKPFPPFNAQQDDLSAYVLKVKQPEFYISQQICYYSKLDITQNTLGAGLFVSKVPRTGAINQALFINDLISNRAYLKEKIHESSSKDPVNCWMPLYFGTNPNEKDKAIHLLKKSISMIMTTSTKRFKEEHILEVFPKIMTSSISQLMTQQNKVSYRFIEMIGHFHCLYLLMMSLYPNLQQQLEDRLNSFIQQEQNRHKNFCPNLGAMMCFLIGSQKIGFEQLLPSYQSEQFDRQVLWMVKALPELANKQIDEVLNNERRLEITFKSCIGGYRILCFFKVYFELTKNLKLADFEKNGGKLSEAVESKIFKQIENIYSDINTYQKYFQFLGSPKKDEEVIKILSQAIQNSSQKLYHGKFQEINKIPDNKVLIQGVLPAYKDYQNYYEIVDQSNKKEKQFKYEIKEKVQKTEEEWKQICIDRWYWIKQVFRYFKDISISDIIQLSSKILQNKTYLPKNIINQFIHEQKQKAVKVDLPEYPNLQHTWKQIYLRFDLEESIKYLNQSTDFELFYQRLEICKDQLEEVTIPIIDVKNIKSGYFYISQILSKFTRLSSIQLVQLCTAFPVKGLQQLKKGVTNLNKNLKQPIKQIKLINVKFHGKVLEIEEHVFNIFEQLSKLEQISFDDVNLFSFGACSKRFSQLLTVLPNLQVLQLINNSILTAVQAKDIADGLMRCKKIQIVNMQNNQSMSIIGVKAVIYSLAFQPNFRYFNISKTLASKNLIVDMIENITKLLTITGSLEYLDISQNFTNSSFSEDFFKALGQIKSLKYLNLSNGDNFTAITITNLGKAVAFNAKNNGILENLDISNTVKACNNLEKFYEAMTISEYDYEVWYGDSIKASKMEGASHSKVYHNNLKALQLDNSCLNSGFNITSHKKYNKVSTSLMKLFSLSKELNALYLSKSSVTKADIDMFTICLDPSMPNLFSNIRTLDLSKNNLRKEGIKALTKLFRQGTQFEIVDLSGNKMGVAGGIDLAQSLENNKTIKQLNIFNNQIAFDGAKQFAKTLQVNGALEFIDFGHNRIRNKGMVLLGEGIQKNPNSKIRSLGLRFNFLSEDGIIDFLKVLPKESKIENIFIKNNSISEFGLYSLKASYDNLNSNIQLDIFDKFHNLTQEKLERSIWCHPINDNNLNQLVQLFTNKECGMIMESRVQTGPKWPNRTKLPNTFAIIEFAHPKQADKALGLGAKQKVNIGGQKIRVFKAGTGTFSYQKNLKQKKPAEAKRPVRKR